MDITYLGHSCFKLRGKEASVVVDPYTKEVGFSLPSVSADIVAVSHDHFDHSNHKAIKGTSRRKEPFLINFPGEYEILGTSVFGIHSYHDDKKGEERGKNTMFVFHVDGVSVAHLGDLGQNLSDKQLEELDGVDVLLCPVGGVYTIGPKQAVDTISTIQPSYVIPMHYKTSKHAGKAFAEVGSLDDFLKEMGTTDAKKLDKLAVSPLSLPEETEVVVLTS
ncbi:MBL fold metallo-hydrolase [Patescibacteria group bacterium]